ncbi:uncharacterized protein ACLA_075550 [Aspergillus clavatus NRRL 1]|uniref:Uncharacterized protein n=1 Tax=Aspergillus clavatus (strain ATCC 1007 / CBS 513.65 / DSM 816 / NCTC 3887 / NRRL 1 / QM 1276 / 107) TaxID=344612 RepID=A1C7Z5_ASPCL|nr:uncharacterized protein ACLA_075550 [Aspergillus clavatus NRRL 1]EAW14516.1 hypothetical protein ACLA_075550 [Aspergillus clavatus NRRL 1]
MNSKQGDPECITPSASHILQMFGLGVSKRARNESDSEDEGPYRPRRRTQEMPLRGGSQVQTDNEPQDPGVDASDMPIAPDTPTELQKRYQNLPPVRKLDWQLDSKGKHIRKPLKTSLTLTAAFAHTRETEASSPCNPCKEGREKHHVRNTTDTSFVSGDVAPTSTDNSRAEASQKPEKQSSSVTQDKPVVQTQAPSAPPKDEPQNQPSLNQILARNSPLDGRVIPFPLGPETIDNLPLLEQAIKDLTGHLETINRRVQQLEDRQRLAMNPWELV